jgi:Kef-type K+ transport system membrane component KefB
MDPLLQSVLAAATIVVAARSAGYACTRLGHSAVLGGLLVSLVLGPALLDILHWSIFGDPRLGEALSA